MMTQLGAGAPGPDPAPRRASEGDLIDPTLLATALVATLEEALAVARRLLPELARATLNASGPDPSGPGPDPGVLSRREASGIRRGLIRVAAFW